MNKKCVFFMNNQIFCLPLKACIFVTDLLKRIFGKCYNIKTFEIYHQITLRTSTETRHSCWCQKIKTNCPLQEYNLQKKNIAKKSKKK